MKTFFPKDFKTNPEGTNKISSILVTPRSNSVVATFHDGIIN